MLRPAEGGLLWRTAKADVGQEIALPPQTHRVTYLTLNAIERHFYMEQHKVKGAPTSVWQCQGGLLCICNQITSVNAYQAFGAVQHLRKAMHELVQPAPFLPWVRCSLLSS